MHKQQKGILEKPIIVVFIVIISCLPDVFYIIFTVSVSFYGYLWFYIYEIYVVFICRRDCRLQLACSNILVQYIASLVLESNVFCTWAQC